MKILVTGDFVPRHRVAAQVEKGDYGCLDEVKHIVQGVDYAIVNFESPVVIRDAKPIEKTGPNLKCSEKALECITKAGFSCVTLANNHFRDYGQIGVEDTLNLCHDYNVDYVGGGRTIEEAKKTLHKSIKGERLAIINVCENEWSVATSDYGGSNGLDIVNICRALQIAKEKADYVLLIIHGGIELYNLPTPEMKKLYRFFAEMGADAIVNHHQHCYSGYEVYQGTPIFYGIGNFCFDALNQENIWHTGFMVVLDTLDNKFELIPYKQATKEHIGIQLISDKNEFIKTINDLNSVIDKDENLLASYHSFLLNMKPLWKSLLNPYNGKVLNKLAKLGIIPSFIDNKRRNRLYNLVICESHRDKLLYSIYHDINIEQGSE